MDLLGTQSASSGKTVISVTLPAGSEWRFEVDFSQELTVKVVAGIAEINGTELPNNIEFKFKGIKTSIFAYQDAVLQYHGALLSEYVSDESIVHQYITLHFALQNFRNHAASHQQNQQQNEQARQKQSPRVLVIGQKDSGKTTLAKILASYAVKMDSLPVVVNLNPLEGVYTVPGALSATVVNDIFDVEQGWGQSNLSGASVFHPTQPAVSFYGYETITSNPSYYSKCVANLAQTVEARLRKDPVVHDAGIIVDTPPLTNKDQSLIDEIVGAFSINVVVVLGNERQYIDLKKRYADKLNDKLEGPKPFFNVLKFAKSGGCVDKDEAFMRAQQQQQIKQYFYGERKSILSPYTITFVDYEKLVPYRVVETHTIAASGGGGGGNANQVDVSSVLPIGEGMDEEERALLAGIAEPAEPVKEEEPAKKETTGEPVKDETSEKDTPGQDTEDPPKKEETSETVPPPTVASKETSGLIEKIEPASSYLQNSIIAFTHAARDDNPETVISSGVLCFGYVSTANDTKKKLSILLPVQGHLPNNAVLFGGFRFVD